MTAENSLFRLKPIKEVSHVSLQNANKKFLPFSIKEYMDALPADSRLYLPKDTDEKWLWDERMFVVRKADYIEIEKLNGNRDYGSMREWTFIIITRGMRDSIMLDNCNSIIAQKIPKFEIIIVGADNNKTPAYERAGSKIIKHIPFMEADSAGWITKKKNVGCKAARYDNLCVMHDDVVLALDWYEKMKEWGNNWEACNCQFLSNPTLCWFYEVDGFNKILEPGDFDKRMYIGGHIILLKRFVWDKVKWNEKLFYGQREDVVYSWDLIKSGFLPRVCPAGIILKG